MQAERQFWQSIRGFLSRYISQARDRGMPQTQIDQFEIGITKMMTNNESKQVIISKLCSIDLRTDYNNIILLILLQQLAQCTCKTNQGSNDHPQPNNQDITAPPLINMIISEAVTLLNNQQQIPALVIKQTELICSLMTHPALLRNIDTFRLLHRKLKDVKEFYPTFIKDAQRHSFLKCMQECVEITCKNRNGKIIEFIFNSIYSQLQVEQTSEFYPSRVRILRKIVSKLWCYHQDIFIRSAYLLVHNSCKINTSLQLLSSSISFYEDLFDKLLQRGSLMPLLLFKHIIFNNIERILKGSNSQYLVLEMMLGQLTNIFLPRTLTYFMKYYDWNFMELPICQQSLHLLYQYAENRAHQKKYEFQLIKKHLKNINQRIRIFLQNLADQKAISQQTSIIDCSTKWQLFINKRKQYLQLIDKINNKPKKLLQYIENIINADIRKVFVMKCVHVLHKACQVNSRAMIEVLGANNDTSAQLFTEYINNFLPQSQDVDLEQFIRIFTSNFLLTGEAQQIERVLDRLTKSYFDRQSTTNRNVNSNDLYTFAHAIIILNTDLHNHRNQNKMTEQGFIKMCQGITSLKDMPIQTIKKIYANVKKNQIQHFRDRGKMGQISFINWQALCLDYRSIALDYFDSALSDIGEQCFRMYAKDVLITLIDQKQTAKLESLVIRFQYDDRTYDCEIVQSLRRIADKKPHLPLHIFQKILETANFKNAKITQKMVSYYWLAATLIDNFFIYLPVNLVCEFLLFNSTLRAQLQDNFYLRQNAQLKRIKNSLRYVRKRDTKKSIMDMFSSFLSSRDSDAEDQPPLESELSKRNNFKPLSQKVVQLIKCHPVKRTESIQFILQYIHNDQTKMFDEFLSCLCLLFNLLYRHERCFEMGRKLFEEILGLRESEFTKRINGLKKKDEKKYLLLNGYCQFWVLKLLLSEYCLNVETIFELDELLLKSLTWLNACDKQLIHDLIQELEEKSTIDERIFKDIDTAYRKIHDKNEEEAEWFFNKFGARIADNESEDIVEKESHQVVQKQLEIKKEQEPKDQQQKYQIRQEKQQQHGQATDQLTIPPADALSQDQILLQRINEQIQENIHQAVTITENHILGQPHKVIDSNDKKQQAGQNCPQEQKLSHIEQVQEETSETDKLVQPTTLPTTIVPQQSIAPLNPVPPPTNPSEQPQPSQEQLQSAIQFLLF